MARWILPVLASALLFLPACQVIGVEGSGTIVSEPRAAAGFSRVVVAGVGNAVLVQGAEEGVIVEADDNLMPYIVTEVRDGVLYLDTSPKNANVRLSPSKDIVFRVTFRDLAGIAVSGAGDVTAEAVTAPKLDIAISGAGDILIGGLAADALAVAVSGAGDIEISGEVRTQSVAVSGAGAYKAGELRSAAASVAISGTGDATVWATDSLDARVSGVGSVSFYGEPTLTRSVSGVGSITSLGMHGTSI